MLSEACKWQVMPWQWQSAPEWWLDKMGMYFAAKAETAPAVAARHRRQQEAEARAR